MDPRPGLILSKTPTQKNWLLEPHRRPGLVTRWGQESSHRRQEPKSWRTFNLISQNETPPFHTLLYMLSLRMPLLLSSLGELCILRDPVQMFLSLNPFRTKWCSHLTSLDFWPSLFLPLPGQSRCFHSYPLRPDFFLKRKICVSPCETATGSLLPKAIVLKLQQASESPRRLLKTDGYTTL